MPEKAISNIESPKESDGTDDIKHIEMLEDYIREKKRSFGLVDEFGSGAKPPTVEEVKFQTESEDMPLNLSEGMDLDEVAMPPSSTKNQVKVNPLMLHKLPKVFEEKKIAIEKTEKHVESILNEQTLLDEFEGR